MITNNVSLTPVTPTICFDCDGTLIGQTVYDEDEPKENVINLLKGFSKLGCRVVVWSGGGKDYAQMWVDRLKLNKYVSHVTDKMDKTILPEIAFDDEFVKLAIINIKV